MNTEIQTTEELKSELSKAELEQPHNQNLKQILRGKISIMEQVEPLLEQRERMLAILQHIDKFGITPSGEFVLKKILQETEV